VQQVATPASTNEYDLRIDNAVQRSRQRDRSDPIFSHNHGCREQKTSAGKTWHEGSGSRTGSTPFPQLLSGLDECLQLSGTRKTVVDQPAILIRLLVKITNRRHAEVREAVTEFFEVFFAQNLRLLAIRTAGHFEDDFSIFAICSPPPLRARGDACRTLARLQSNNSATTAWPMGERKRLVCSSDNDNYNEDGRAGLSRIEIDAHGLVQWE
jgi:hypothetical protein